MMNERMAPAVPPYAPDIADAFTRIMPPGVEPLLLFRTMARSPRVLQRMFAGNLLDRGTIDLRERELMILRTCARCRAEYEWGVHVTMFGQRARFTEAEIAATLADTADTGPWNEKERAIVRLADELHDGAGISEALWQELSAHFSSEQILELIALAGYYHAISFMANGLKLDGEHYAARFEQYAMKSR
jgi:alkylhydroperoxidase family enzyme